MFFIVTSEATEAYVDFTLSSLDFYVSCLAVHFCTYLIIDFSLWGEGSIIFLEAIHFVMKVEEPVLFNISLLLPPKHWFE